MRLKLALLVVLVLALGVSVNAQDEMMSPVSFTVTIENVAGIWGISLNLPLPPESDVRTGHFCYQR